MSTDLARRRPAARAPGHAAPIGTSPRSGRVVASLVVALGSLAVVDRILVVGRFARHVVIEDQAVLWYAAREWGRGLPRQPNYYGQSYGSTLEAIPTEMLRWIGLRPGTALPLVVAMLGLAPWLLLAWVALRRQRPLLAVLAAASPLVLSTYFAQYLSFYGAGVGRFLATLALVLVLAWPDRDAAFGAACALGALGLALDPSGMLLVAPVLGYGFLRAPSWRLVAAAAIGAVPAVCWLGYGRWFYDAHPDYELHPSPFAPGLDVLRKTLPHPSRYWQMFAPELVRSWVVPLALATGLVIVLLATRRLRFVAPALLAVATLLLGLGSAKALDGPSPLLPYARLFLLVPLLLWFLAWLVADSGILGRSIRPGSIAIGVAVVTGLAVATFGFRAVTIGDRSAELLAAAGDAAFVFPIVPADQLDARCDAVDVLTRSTGIDFVVFTADRAAAYGCGARSYDTIRTLFPQYERRTWLLHDEADRRREEMILWGVEPQFCDAAGGIVVSCRVVELPPPVSTSAAILRFGPRSSVNVLEDLGVPVRPFGPGCHPQQPATCEPRAQGVASSATRRSSG